MLAAQLVLMFAIIIALIAGYFVIKHKYGKFPHKIYIILSSVLAVVFFLRFMWAEDALENVYQLTNSPVGGKFLTAVSIILNTFLQPTTILLILFPFVKNSRVSTFIKIWGLLVSILCISFVSSVTQGIVGSEAYFNFNLRTLLMGSEIAILFAYSFVVFMENKKFKIEKRNALCFVYIIPMLLFGMMSYVPKALFGYGNEYLVINDLTQWHRIFLYFNFIIPVVIHFVLRKKSFETRKFMLLYLSVIALFVFLNDQRFESWIRVDNWPLHLCHTAMFIIPICLIFRLKKLFYFTYFINVLGAFFAMAMPNTDDGTNILATSLLRFWSNHYFAFFMPLLCVSLKMFPRPKLKEWIYSAVAFTVYFAAIMFVNAWFTGIGRETDFFYINSDFIADKLGQWAEDLRNIKAIFTITYNNYIPGGALCAREPIN